MMQEQEKAVTSTLFFPKKPETESKQTLANFLYKKDPCSSFQELNSGQKISESPILQSNGNQLIQSYSLNLKCLFMLIFRIITRIEKHFSTLQSFRGT